MNANAAQTITILALTTLVYALVARLLNERKLTPQPPFGREPKAQRAA